MVVNYNNGKIYKIHSYVTDKIYIGSTCQKLSVRFASHKAKFKRGLQMSTSKQIFEKDIYCMIELIEKFPSKCKEELNRREGYWIKKEKECVNKLVAGRTKKEYLEENKDKIAANKKIYHKKNIDKLTVKYKQYYKDNKESIIKKRSDYYKDNKQTVALRAVTYRIKNKDKIANYRKEHAIKNKVRLALQRQVQITCDNCGIETNKAHISRHMKTKKCLSFKAAN